MAKAIWVFFCFSGSIAKRLFWLIVCATVPYITNTVITINLTLLPLDLQATLHPTQSRIVTQLFYLALTILQCIIYSRFHVAAKPEASTPFMRWSLPTILALAFLCMAVNAGIINDPDLSAVAANGFVLNSAVFMVVCLGVVLAFDRLSSIIQQELELRHALELQMLQEKERQRASEALRTWRHDIRRAFEPLVVLADTGNLEGVRSYLRDLDITVDALGTGVSTGSAALDAVLITRKAKALSANIPMQITAEQIDFGDINSMQLSVAIANLLDNCIEACRQVPAAERFIDVSIRKLDLMVEIDIINSTNGHYLFTDQGLLSTKPGGDHGHGYDLLQKLMEMTGGYYLTDANQDSYNVRVYLPAEAHKNGGISDADDRLD
ncbi:MAG: GHKL domain-containing protein [Clostridia bacterium]|nr:GHKL domain-containing protein [Clostridia bacterium]